MTTPKARFANTEDADKWLETHTYSPSFVDQDHALVTGMVMGCLVKGEVFTEAAPVKDPDGNYTQHILITKGRTYRITVEPEEHG